MNGKISNDFNASTVRSFDKLSTGFEALKG
jgi:hypothetical protein